MRPPLSPAGSPGACGHGGVCCLRLRGLGEHPGALADAESRMLAVLDELGPTGLVTTIPGLSAVGAEVIY